MNFANVTSLTIPQGEVIQIQDSLSRILWKKNTIDYSEPFWVESANGQSGYVKIKKSDASASGVRIYTSTDNINWTDKGYASTDGVNVPFATASKTYIKCSGLWYQSSYTYNSFSTSTQDINIGGNIMSLIYGTNFTGDERAFPSGRTYALYNIFRGIKTYVMSVENLLLPATTLAESCYMSLFYGFTNITSAPELPATTLASSCYSGMFQGCSSLVVAPTLPAETLTTDCYENMFNGCTSLEEVHMLATTWDAGTDYWLVDVAETGTFYMNPNAEYDPLDYVGNSSGIPENWDVRYEGE